jgi:catalase
VDLPSSGALSIHKNMKETLDGRAVGILFAEGSDASTLDSLVAAVEAEGGKAVLVSPKVNGAPLSDGSKRKADGQLAGTPSQLFDAVAVVVSEDGCAALLKEAAAVQFVMDAFGHLKAIGASAEAQPLLDKAGVQKDEGVTTPDGSFVSAAKRRFYDREPAIRMLA